MAKKKLDLNNLNINLEIENTVETVEIPEEIKDVETLENLNISYNNELYILRKKADTDTFELVKADIETMKDRINTIKKQSDNRVIKTKDADKLQTGYYFDSLINPLIKHYLKELNSYLKSQKGKNYKKVFKVDFTDNVLYNFFKTEGVWNKDLNTMLENKEKYAKKGTQLLSYLVKDIPLEKIMTNDEIAKSRQGLYGTKDIVTKLVETHPLFLNADKYDTSYFLNCIFKQYFIAHCNVDRAIFLDKNYDVTQIKFKVADFDNYFNISKLVIDDEKRA
ncbi:hypothetical protein DSH77_13725 [Enterococcus faecium]|nr:hypothetical protein [Enterococcus faecium]